MKYAHRTTTQRINVVESKNMIPLAMILKSQTMKAIGLAHLQ